MSKKSQNEPKIFKIMQTENLEKLRELRAQEKAVKASIESIKPLAIEEAKALCPDGGKFEVDGVGEFILDINPVLEKDPKDKDFDQYTGPNILTSRDEDALAYRQNLRQQKVYKTQASALTKTIKGFYDAFRAKFARKATSHNYTIKVVGVE